MKDTLITFETAKLAKEKGFNWPCRHNIWAYQSYSETETLEVNENYTTIRCSAPTQSLLQKWLREVHNIDVLIHTIHREPSDKYPNSKGWYYTINHKYKEIHYSKYEEALEAGLLQLLKLIK